MDGLFANLWSVYVVYLQNLEVQILKAEGNFIFNCGTGGLAFSWKIKGHSQFSFRIRTFECKNQKRNRNQQKKKKKNYTNESWKAYALNEHEDCGRQFV